VGGSSHRYRRTIAVLGVVLLASVLLAVAVGAIWISPTTTLRLVAWKLGLTKAPANSYIDYVILFQLRLPRVALAGLVGAGLAVSGMLFQGLFRNPLADPAIIGVSSGAALGGVLVIVLGAGWLASVAGGLGIAAAAFLTAMLTALLVYRLARIGPTVQVATLLLSGVALAAVISAVISLVMSIASQQVEQIYFWLLGGFGNASTQQVLAILPFIVFGVFAAASLASALNVVSLGEERAAQLGVDVDSVRRRTLAAGALLAAAAVSVAGVIGFVGLMTPHLMRPLIGADNRRLLPAVVLAGASFLILADLVARTVIAPQELPVGAITALLGGPFFIYLLWRERRSAGDRD
jgi:iron complex transport system permease protein